VSKANVGEPEQLGQRVIVVKKDLEVKKEQPAKSDIRDLLVKKVLVDRKVKLVLRVRPDHAVVQELPVSKVQGDYVVQQVQPVKEVSRVSVVQQV